MSRAKNPSIAVLKRSNGAEKVGFGSENVDTGLKARVVMVASVGDLAGVQAINNAVYQVASYRAGEQVGGGEWIYREGYSKTNHNGVTVIDSDRPFPADWDNKAQVDDWFTAAASGTGCFVKTWALARSAYEAGMTNAAAVSDTLISNALLAGLAESGGRLAIMPFEKAIGFDDKVEVPKGIAVDLNGAQCTFNVTGEVYAFRMNSKTKLYNGVSKVVGTAASGAGDFQAAVSGGNQSTGEGVKNVEVYDLTVETNRAGGSGIVFFGGSRQCRVHDIFYPDSATIGQVIAFEWGGKDVTTTQHPHNCTIQNIKTGAITGGNQVIWLSSAFNMDVQNVYCKAAYGVLGLFTGDKSNDNAKAEYKRLVGTGVTVKNLQCDLVYKYGVRVYGIPSLGTNRLNHSATLENIVLRGDGSTANTFGLELTACNGLTVINPDISGFDFGLKTKQDVQNLTVLGGKVYENRHDGLSIGDVTIAPKNVVIDGVSVYANNQAAIGGYGVLIENGKNIRVINGRFGLDSGETQLNSVRILDDARNCHLEGNHTYGTGAGTAYVNGVTGSDQWDMGTTGENNTAEAGITVGAGTPLFRYNWRSQKEAVIVGTSAPVAGTWALGDRVYFSAPVASGNVGAVCVAPGSPGSWKTFGDISA